MSAAGDEVGNKQLVALNFTEGVFTLSIGVIRRESGVISAFVNMLTPA